MLTLPERGLLLLRPFESLSLSFELGVDGLDLEESIDVGVGERYERGDLERGGVAGGEEDFFLWGLEESFWVAAVVGVGGMNVSSGAE